MPSRNIIKEDAPESYYHVYARGVGKQAIFLDAEDFAYFQNLFSRYLSDKQLSHKTGYVYPNYYQQLELIAFCLMGNHFHMLVYQTEPKMMSNFMRSLMTSYSRYFNLKYERTGPLFESLYKASRISQQSYLEHISRYIHLNPRYWQRYLYSSLKYYYQESPPVWLKNDKITSLFAGKSEYLSFLKDYEDHQQMLHEIKKELAVN